MFVAAKEGCCESVKTLLSYYANREITDHLDRLPRDIASEKNHRDIMKLLVEYPVDMPVAYGNGQHHSGGMYPYPQHASIHRNGSLPRSVHGNKAAKRRPRKMATKTKSTLKQPATVALPDDDQMPQAAKKKKKNAVVRRESAAANYAVRKGDSPPSYDQACSSRAMEGNGHYGSEPLFDPDWSSPTSSDHISTNHRLLSESSTNGLASCSGSPLSPMTNSPPCASEIMSSPITSNYSPCGAATEMSPPGAQILSPLGAQTLSPSLTQTLSPPLTQTLSPPGGMPQHMAQQQYMVQQNVYSPPTQNSPASQMMPMGHEYDRQLHPQHCVPEPSYPTPPSQHERHVIIQQHHSSFPTPSPESGESLGESLGPGEWSSDPQSSPPNWRDHQGSTQIPATRNVDLSQLSAYY